MLGLLLKDLAFAHAVATETQVPSGLSLKGLGLALAVATRFQAPSARQGTQTLIR